MKSLSPRQISLYIAICITLILLVSFLLLFYFYNYSFNSIFLIVSSSITFITSYFISTIFINLFLESRIRLIYKNIKQHKTKDNEKNSRLKFNKDVISNVNQEVEDWKARNEKELENLKELEQYRREFIGNLAHELKTPIFSVQGYILTLLEGGLEDESINKKFLHRAALGIERMNSIVEDLDAISKIESAKLELEIVKFDVVKLVREIFESLERKAKKKNITLQFQNEYDPIYVLGDRERIDQVISNLIVNSINYGKTDGTSTVRFFDMDENILVEIADNGIGIKEKHFPRLFERFYRVDKSRSRNEGGTGLGLAIVKHIIEAHKQSINVRSTVDLGSTFSFTLEKG